MTDFIASDRERASTHANENLDEAARAHARDGDDAKFFACVARGADPTTTNDKGETAMMLAAQSDARRIVYALLDAGAPWYQVDDDGACAGEHAAGHGNVELARGMMERARDIECDRGRRAMASGGRALGEGESSKDDERVGYLATSATYDGEERLLDAEGDAVMMTWETPLMKAHADVIARRGGDVLNVGFGLGVIDEFLAAKETTSHVIVEAHPDVRKHMTRKGWDDRPRVQIEFGRWQDVIPQFIERNVTFDGVFFDTYGEEYDDMRVFHAMLPKILKPGGVYSYFNGMCPDNAFFHSVYNLVAERELSEIGFKVTFDVVPIDASADAIWNGVKRRYWWGNKYFLPTCVFEG